ncbi:cobalamin B12-binding domain-containing protein [Nocardioides pelophilus]|uniref:cobalamin B12-binding domain-containing protein n=1 Tax=Nocardioides pelophilus TaxID=2172019 RepID=UPI0016020949|nr:cobalamin-dependent protein [Nocardioides pelophilus]
MEGTYDRYFAAVSAPDAVVAAEVLDEALTRGVPPSSLITDVLARAQRAVGEKWMSGDWTVADEHAATAVTKQVLTVVAPPRLEPGTRLRVVVACAEGEWHSLPARMAGELLRGDDLAVTILGANIQVDQLRQYLRSTVPDVLALSATMPTSLIGAANCIAAARAEGVPTVVGGGAWGRGQQRARALGAHLRLDDIRELRGRLETVRAMEPPPLPEIPAEAHWLHEVPREVVAAAFDRQRDDLGSAPDDRDPAERHKELRWIAQHLAAAIACDDASVVADVLDWLIALHAARGLPAAPVLEGARHLADAIGARAPRGEALLRQEVETAHDRITVVVGDPGSASPRRRRQRPGRST